MTSIILNGNREINYFKDKLPILATEEYLKYKSDHYGWLVSEKFILPFFLHKKYIFKIIYFTTNLIYLDNGSIDEEKMFLNEAVALLRINKIDLIGQPEPNAVFNTYPDGSIFAGYGTFTIDLRLSEDELFQNIQSRFKQYIRRAERDGVIIENGDRFMVDCYQNIKSMNDRENRSGVSLEEIKRMKEKLNEHLVFYVAKRDDDIHGSLIAAWNKGHSCFSLYGGSSADAHPGAVKLLYWQGLLDMKKLGVRYFDFRGARIKPKEGSRLEGIQQFKSRMGGKMQTGYLWKYAINPLKCSLYVSLLKAKLKIKGVKYVGDIIDEENEVSNMSG